MSEGTLHGHADGPSPLISCYHGKGVIDALYPGLPPGAQISGEWLGSHILSLLTMLPDITLIRQGS